MDKEYEGIQFSPKNRNYRGIRLTHIIPNPNNYIQGHKVYIFAIINNNINHPLISLKEESYQ